MATDPHCRWGESKNRLTKSCERHYRYRKLRCRSDRLGWIRGGSLTIAGIGLSILILDGIAGGVFAFGGMAVGILLAVGGVFSLGYAFGGLSLSLIDMYYEIL